MKAALIPVFLLAATTSANAQPRFFTIGNLNAGENDFSSILDVSNNGIAVGVSASPAGRPAIAWSPKSGLRPLGDLPGGQIESTATAVSADGSVIAGWGTTTFSISERSSFREVNKGTLENLGQLPGGNVQSFPWSVSADGQRIMGIAETDTETLVYNWSESSGMQAIGNISHFDKETNTFIDWTADANMFAGTYLNSDDKREAYRWTVQNGIEPIGFVDETDEFSEASGISSDGSIIVGSVSKSFLDTDVRATIWSSQDGMTELPALDDADITRALDVSDDGSVIVGTARLQGEPDFFGIIWTPDHGPRTISEILGSDLQGFSIDRIEHVSPDGTVVAGTGVNSDGELEGFVFFIPAPATAVLPALAIGVLSRRRR